MASAAFWSYALLVIASALLLYAAANDLRHFKIPNELVIVLAALFFAHAWFSGHWVHLHRNLLMAAAVFVFLVFAYNRAVLGGGDVKLLTVAFLWTGFDCALPLAVLLTVFAAIHLGALKLGLVGARDDGQRQRVPYAPVIAAALIGTFMLGCLHPV